MTDTPWTPGPWIVATPTQGYEVCTIHGVEAQPTEDGLGRTWVYVRPETMLRDGEWHWPDGQEQLANARLIAAAPDMAEALEALDAYWLETIPEGPPAEGADHWLHPDCAKVWRHVRAALAKARGQS